MSEYDEPPEPSEAQEREHAMASAVMNTPGVTITGLTAQAIEIIVRETIENNHQITDRAQRHAEHIVDKTLKFLVAETAHQLIVDRVTKILDEGWEKHDTYGNKKGERITVHSIVADVLNEKTRDGNYNSPERTLIQRLAKQAAEACIDKAFAAELAEAKAGFRAQVDELLKGKLVTSLKEALGLK